MRRQQFDLVGRHAHRFVHRARDFGLDSFFVARCQPTAHLSGHHQLFRSTARIRRPERHDASGAHALHAARHLLDFVRIQIPAALDDYVLRAASNINFAVREIGVIA